MEMECPRFFKIVGVWGDVRYSPDFCVIHYTTAFLFISGASHLLAVYFLKYKGIVLLRPRNVGNEDIDKPRRYIKCQFGMSEGYRSLMDRI